MSLPGLWQNLWVIFQVGKMLRLIGKQSTDTRPDTSKKTLQWPQRLFVGAQAQKPILLRPPLI